MTRRPTIGVVCIGLIAASFALATSGCGGASAEKHAKLDADAVRVVRAIAGLGSRTEAAQSDLTNFPPDLLSERKDFAFVHPYLLETMHAASAHSACTDAGNVQAGAQDVRTDLSLVRGDIQTFNGDARRVSTAIAQINTDAATLRGSIKTIRYTPPSTPSPLTVSSAISAARTELAAARRSVASYLETANHLLGEAGGYAERARAVCAQHA